MKNVRRTSLARIVMRTLSMVFCSVALWFASCKEQAEPQIVTLDEISGVSSKPEKDTSYQQEPQQTWTDITPPLAVFFQAQNIPLAELEPTEKGLFLDRFHAQITAKWKHQKGNDSTFYFYYRFQDSLQTKSAFFNWLDCFGEACQTLSVLPENKQKVKSGGHLLWVSEHEIFYVTGNRTPKPSAWFDLRFSEHEKTEKSRILFAGQQAAFGNWRWLSVEQITANTLK